MTLAGLPSRLDCLPACRIEPQKRAQSPQTAAQGPAPRAQHDPGRRAAAAADAECDTCCDPFLRSPADALCWLCGCGVVVSAGVWTDWCGDWGGRGGRRCLIKGAAQLEKREARAVGDGPTAAWRASLAVLCVFVRVCRGHQAVARLNSTARCRQQPYSPDAPRHHQHHSQLQTLDQRAAHPRHHAPPPGGPAARCITQLGHGCTQLLHLFCVDAHSFQVVVTAGGRCYSRPLTSDAHSAASVLNAHPSC